MAAEIEAADISDAELEHVAKAIASAPLRSRETIRGIILDHPQIRRLVVANAVRCLGARKWWYDSRKKRRVEEPDYQLRFRALEFLSDRVDGRPAQALFNVNVNEGERRVPSEPLATPATIAAMERALAAAKEQLARVNNGGSERSSPSPAAVPATLTS